MTVLSKQTAKRLALRKGRDILKPLPDPNKYNEKVNLNQLVKDQVGEIAYAYLSQYVDFEQESTFVEATATRFNLLKISPGKYKTIVNLKRVNDIRWINKFFETVNSKLNNGNLFIGFVETKNNRKARILKRHFFPFNWLRYSADFVLHRVMPKIKFTKKIYFSITKGHNRVLTKAETLGRLVSCGFEIKDVKEIGKLTWFVTEKIKEPVFDPNPSYGPFFKMRRVGKDGKIIRVYKLRTMHPFSEYLQGYMVKTHGYDNEGKGKIKNDFRNTTLGAFFRRYWIDELPQLINILKGEMKLVGVRPLSITRFNEFPDNVKKRRTKYKPGCFPPYVALLMPNEEDNIKAEEIYLDQKEKHPVWTDVKFFWLSIYNIVTNKIRSA